MAKSRSGIGALAEQRPAAPDPVVGTGRPSDHFVGLNLKLPPSVRNAFKAYAAARGVSMVQLFWAMFEQYKAVND